MGTALTLFSDWDGKENKKQINEEEKKKKRSMGRHHVVLEAMLICSSKDTLLSKTTPAGAPAWLALH